MCLRSIPAAVFAATAFAGFLLGQGSTTLTTQPHDRITASVNSGQTVVLSGNVHPLTMGSASQATTSEVPMQQMILSLKPDAQQSAALEQLIAQQQDPKSPLYHRFLSPQEFGAHFGVSQADLDKTVAWLAAHGFTIDEIPTGRRTIVFSGTSTHIANAFNTKIRQYISADKVHFANATDPQIPAALADVVGGIVKLHDFQHKPSLVTVKAVPKANAEAAQFTSSSGSHYLSPADYSTIYNLKTLSSSGVDGTGQSIAVIARSHISLSDIQSFRQSFGLPVNDPTIVIVNSDPGTLQGDSTETTLDTEWAGAIAPRASIKVITAASTSSADGIDLAAQFAVNHNVAPIITLSYGSCEAYMGSAGTAFYHSLWQQAAAQGQTVLVSSGDSGAAGCNGGSDSSGSMTGVNGLCTSPYSTCVGGTQFNDNGNPGQYWLPGNNSVYGSAISYVPEVVWNESGSNGGSGLWAGGGGPSLYFSKPSWQSGPGVPADGRRDVPDVSLTAAGHDGYIIVQYGSMYAVGGTSAAAPSFAGMMALVNQQTGVRQGNANTVLYPLAANQANGGAAVFHDITSGSNTVPGVTGFKATAGYDLASGLGSVDAALMVRHWTDASKPVSPTITLTASSTSLSLKAGTSLQATITSTTSSTLKTAVTLSVSGVPPGLTATLGASSIASPGSGAVALTITAASNLKGGTYNFNVNAQGGGQATTVAISVVVPTPTFTLAASTTVAAYTADSPILPVTLTPQNGFSSPVTMSLKGLAPGVAATFTSSTVNVNTVATTNVNFAISKAATAGSYPLTITAIGGGITQSTLVTLVISARASCTLAANPGSLKLTAGQAASIQVVCGNIQGNFSTPLTYAVTGQPSGVAAAFSSVAAAAGATTTLNLNSPLSAVNGSYGLIVVANAPGFTQSLVVPLTISAASTFTLTPSTTSVTVKPGGSGQIGFSLAHVGGFNSAVALTVSGVPAGVSAALSRTSMPAPGDGLNSMAFAVLSTAKPGTYPIILTASGGGVTQTALLSLTVASPADFAFSVSSNSLAVQQGGAAANLTVSTGNFTGGFNSTITITYTNLAPGMNWRWIGGTAANNMVNNTVGFFVPAYTPVGVYPITVTATGAGITHSATINITVTTAAGQNKK